MPDPKDKDNKNEDGDIFLWQPIQGAAIVYDIVKDKIIIEQRPSLS